MAEDDNSLQFDSQLLTSSPDSENNLQDCSLVFTESQAADSYVTQPPSDHVSESPYSSYSQSPQPSTSHQVPASKDMIEVSSSEEESQSVILKKSRKLTPGFHVLDGLSVLFRESWCLILWIEHSI